MDLDIACHLNVVVAGADPHHLGEHLTALRELGYRRVVLPPLNPQSSDAAELARIFLACDVAPITIAGQGPGADVSSADDAQRRAGAEALRAAVDFTAALGGDQMNGVPYGLFGHPSTPTSRAALERAAREVGAVADHAAARGITMTFEVLNRYETSVVNTAAQAMDFVALSGSENLRVHLDTFHMLVEEADIAAAIRTAMPRLGYLELGQSGRGPLSSGAADIARIVQGALDDGYDGRWGIEAFSRPLLDEPVADMLAIWRDPFHDGVELASDAVRVIRRGWGSSSAGRRAERLARRAEKFEPHAT